ncbi:phosphatase PAP2 family protein [Hymenobacter sp. BT730]|uniref:phosphatase PAP2 family protein n=1 Tax=Hymenobacter sp. BT730 TaxID=3063332 RepID=UPI0026DF8CF0|nr:phosphatase PAP2 family protein [Hymenobacter sp. BT730]
MMLAKLLFLIRRFLHTHWVLLALLLFSFVGPWIIFVEVAEDIWESGGFFGDKAILEFIHGYATPTLDKVALALTNAGGPPPMLTTGFVLTAGLFLWRRRTDALFFALSVGGAIMLNLLVKAAFGRPRPALWNSVAPGIYYSFPSGHAMGSMALAAAIGFLVWRSSWRWPIWILGGLFALGVGLSRMYLGVHYPSDVLAGWVGSLGWVGGLHILFSPAFQQLRAWWHLGEAYWEKGRQYLKRNGH